MQMIIQIASAVGKKFLCWVRKVLGLEREGRSGAWRPGGGKMTSAS